MRETEILIFRRNEEGNTKVYGRVLFEPGNFPTEDIPFNTTDGYTGVLNLSGISRSMRGENIARVYLLDMAPKDVSVSRQTATGWQTAAGGEIVGIQIRPIEAIRRGERRRRLAAREWFRVAGIVS